MRINISFDEKNYKMVKDVNVGECFVMLGKKDLFIMADDETFLSLKTGETFYVEVYEEYPAEIKENLAIYEQTEF